MKAPDFTLVEPQAAGPRKVVINPELIAPAGGATFTGQGLFNSGLLLGPADAPPGAPHSYSLTFSTAGRYGYACMVHVQAGMYGFITVLPAGSTLGMPTTGQGVTDLGAALALVAGLALAVLGIGPRRRAVGAR